MAQDTLAVMDQLGIAKAHIAGISMGSAIAQHVALESPERVFSLSLHCSWMACDTYTRRIFETFRSAYDVLPIEEFQRLLQLFIFTPQYHEDHLDDLLLRQQAAAAAKGQMPVHAFQAQCDACLAHDTMGRLREIQVPVLLTVGDRDIFTPLSLTQLIQQEIPHAELAVFRGSGHTHHWDQLEEFNRLTTAFLMKQREA